MQPNTQQFGTKNHHYFTNRTTIKPNFTKPFHTPQVQTATCSSTLCFKKKTRHLIFYHYFGKCEPIFKILSQPYSSGNSLNIYDKDIHNTLIMLPHYRGKRLTIVRSHQREQTLRNSWMEAKKQSMDS